MDKLERIKQLIKELNNASYAYYNQVPIMPDYEWDKMYDELVNLEEETGIVLSNSPTYNVGYSVADELKEVEHNHPMLSLDKTKSVDELIEFIKNKDCFLSVKADGLTTSLHYINGKLIGAETRGDGVRGTECLQNVLTMKNVPKEIPYKDELIIDGETIIGWDTFREINDKLSEDKKYKHPRNLVSGSLQLRQTEATSHIHLQKMTGSGCPHYSRRTGIITISPVHRITSPTICLYYLFFISLSVQILHQIRIFECRYINPSPIITYPTSYRQLIIQSESRQPKSSGSKTLVFR